jgi:hypothetical protein
MQSGKAIQPAECFLTARDSWVSWRLRELPVCPQVSHVCPQVSQVSVPKEYTAQRGSVAPHV